MDSNQIHQLIENSPFDQNTIGKLELYLAQQLQSKTYDFQANKALLQYYQVNPNAIKLDVVCNLLILSLMRLPSNDLLSLVYMLPPKCVGNSRIQVIQDCATCLEKGRYTDFWEEYISAPENLFTPANGFVDFIRRYILGNLRDTYTAMPSSLFAQQLGLNESNVEAFCNGNKFIEKVRSSVI
jgi:translation initiation factor 3 subunit K